MHLMFSMEPCSLQSEHQTRSFTTAPKRSDLVSNATVSRLLIPLAYMRNGLHSLSRSKVVRARLANKMDERGILTTFAERSVCGAWSSTSCDVWRIMASVDVLTAERCGSGIAAKEDDLRTAEQHFDRVLYI